MSKQGFLKCTIVITAILLLGLTVFIGACIPGPALYLSNLSLSDNEINSGESVTVSLSVDNPQEASGTIQVNAYLNGAYIYGVPVAMESHEEHKVVTFPLNPSEPGIYTVTVDGITDGKQFTVVDPSANEPPYFAAIGDKSAFVGEPLTFAIEGTDPEDDELTFSIEVGPTEANINANTGVFSWTPNSEDIGPNTVRFKVSDGTGEDSESIIITVEEPSTETPVDNNVIHIPVGTKNYYMALSPNKSTLYVGDYGPVLQGGLGHVWVIDTASNEVTGEIANLGDGFPYQIVFNPDGREAYLAVTKRAGSTLTDGSNRIVVINTSDKKVMGTINIEGAQDFGPVTVAMHPNGDYVYTTHHGLNRIDAIDTASDTVVTSIGDVGSVPMGIAITPDETRLWVVNSVGNSLAVINIESSQMQLIQQSIPHGLEPSGGHAFITITPDGTRAYVTNQGDSRIAVVNIDPSSGDDYLSVDYVQTTATVLNQVAISPDGTRALVGNTTDSVLIIDTDPLSENENYNQQIDAIFIGYPTVGVVYADLPDALAYVAGAENVGVITELP